MTYQCIPLNNFKNINQTVFMAILGFRQKKSDQNFAQPIIMKDRLQELI